MQKIFNVPWKSLEVLLAVLPAYMFLFLLHFRLFPSPWKTLSPCSLHSGALLLLSSPPAVPYAGPSLKPQMGRAGPGQAPQATSPYHTVTIAFYCHPLSSVAHRSRTSSPAPILFRAMAEGRCQHCLSKAGHPGPWGQSHLEDFQLWQLPDVWAACSCYHPQRKQMFSKLLGTSLYTWICPSLWLGALGLPPQLLPIGGAPAGGHSVLADPAQPCLPKGQRRGEKKPSGVHRVEHSIERPKWNWPVRGSNPRPWRY